MGRWRMGGGSWVLDGGGVCVCVCLGGGQWGREIESFRSGTSFLLETQEEDNDDKEERLWFGAKKHYLSNSGRTAADVLSDRHSGGPRTFGLLVWRKQRMGGCFCSITQHTDAN